MQEKRKLIKSIYLSLQNLETLKQSTPVPLRRDSMAESVKEKLYGNSKLGCEKL